MDLRSQILLDESFEAGNAFAAPGTPSAVLVDAGGRVASEVAAGADACFALARSRRGRRQLERVRPPSIGITAPVR